MEELDEWTRILTTGPKSPRIRPLLLAQAMLMHAKVEKLQEEETEAD